MPDALQVGRPLEEMFPKADFRYTTILVGLRKLEPLGSCQFDFQNFLRKKRIEVGKGV